MFPTKGTKYHWISSDGRKIHVNELSLPHLANILIQLHESAAKELRINLEGAGEFSHKFINSYLNENCFTWPQLESRAYSVDFLKDKKITSFCREQSGNGRTKKSLESIKELTPYEILGPILAMYLTSKQFHECVVLLSQRVK